MFEYDYYEAVKNDVLKYIKDNINLDDWKGNREELEERLNYILWTSDSVTGYGSGSYTFSTYQAEENLCHNFDLLKEVLADFGYDAGYLLKQGAEAADVIIRCYLLGSTIAEVLDELEDELADDKYESFEDFCGEKNVKKDFDCRSYFYFLLTL